MLKLTDYRTGKHSCITKYVQIVYTGLTKQKLTMY